MLVDESAPTAMEYSRVASCPTVTILGMIKILGSNYFERPAVTASLILLSGAYFYAAMSRSIADHFWMDEVLAVSAASQSSLSRVWEAIWAGTDFSPPAYHFFLHGFVRIFGADEGRWVWRLPSIFAVYGAAWCTYAFVLKSRVNRLAAVLAFGIVLSFSLFEFAIQVREYALLALGLALALLIWSGMDDASARKIRAVGLWLVLGACLCLHFYGIVVVATIGVAELIYWVSRRRFRTAVWLVLLLTAPVEAALYPLASHLAAFNNGDTHAPAYYAKPTWGRLFRAVFDVVDGGMYGMLLLLCAFSVLVAGHLLGRSKESVVGAASARTRRTFRWSTIEIAIISLCLLPLMTFAFSFFVTGSFSVRYIAGDALLPAIAAAFLVDRARSPGLLALLLVPIMTGVLLVQCRAEDPIADALSVVQKAERPYPIVVGEGLLYIELMQAADARTRAKLVYLKRPSGSVSPDPTNENEVLRLATFHPEYRVSDQASFLKANASFYVLERPGATIDTTTPALTARGLLGPPAESKNGVLLYQASARQGAQ
jgi:hypothetical protein